MSGYLGRLYVPDKRDAEHGMARLLAPTPIRTQPWKIGPILDQGATSMCTAFGWRAWKNAEPVMDPLDQDPSDNTFYAQEQAIDGIPRPHDGSTVRAGASLLLKTGRIGEYVWAASADEAAQWLTTKSPVVLGTNWYAGMDSPVNGIVSVSGELRGGHCYLCYWYDSANKLFLCQNSWGRGYGNGGFFAIPFDGMARLLNEQGEACAAVEIVPQKEGVISCIISGLLSLLLRRG